MLPNNNNNTSWGGWHQQQQQARIVHVNCYRPHENFDADYLSSAHHGRALAPSRGGVAPDLHFLRRPPPRAEVARICWYTHLTPALLARPCQVPRHHHLELRRRFLHVRLPLADFDPPPCLAAPTALYCFVASRVEVTLRLLALACLGAQFGCAGSNVDYVCGSLADRGG